MKPSSARIYCDAFAKVEDMTGIKGDVCGDSGENGNGGDNGNETGDGSFLNSSKMEITGSTVFYYGTYMYGSNENIQVTKFNKSGDTYDGNYTIDLSKYASMSGMD